MIRVSFNCAYEMEVTCGLWPLPTMVGCRIEVHVEPIATQDLLPKQLVRGGIQSDRLSIETQRTHAAFLSISAGKFCFWAGEEELEESLGRGQERLGIAVVEIRLVQEVGADHPQPICSRLIAT